MRKAKMNSFRFAILLIILLAIGCTQTGDRQDLKTGGGEWTQIQKDVWEMEERYWTSLKNGDLDGYMALWHSDFIGWPRDYNRPVNRDSIGTFIKSIMDRSVPGSLSYELKPYAVNVFGNIAIVFYSHHSTYENLEGERVELRERITHTWMKYGGEWTIIGGISAL